MRLIYLASPYTSPFTPIRRKRYERVLKLLAWHLENVPDVCLFSPIAHWHPTATAHDLAIDFNRYAEMDFFMIRKAHSVWVFCDEDWDQSYGIQQEMEFRYRHR